MKTKILILTFSLLVSGFVNLSFSYDHVRYVDVANGDDANTGTSPGVLAWKNIFYAATRINSDTSILAGQTTILYVASGTYSTVMPPGDKTNITIGISDFTIMGDGLGSTIIDGSGGNGHWTEGIQTKDGINNATITGVTVKNFTGAGVSFYSGTGNSVNLCELSGNTYGVAGYGYVTESSSGIYNNIIKDNDQGVYLFSEFTPVFSEIKDNSISMNSTAGIYISTGESESNPVISGNTIFNNPIGIKAVVGSAASSPEILNNRLYDNGIGIKLNAGGATTSFPQIINNVIYKNSEELVHGILLYGGVTDSVLNVKIHHNTIDGGSSIGIVSDALDGSITADIKYCIITNFSMYGIYSKLDSTLNIDYVDVWNNVAANFYNCDVTTKNYDVDPQYAADYSLMVTSPCIDKVPVSEADPLNHDIIGTSRPRRKESGGLNQHDLGAYEYPYKSYDFTMPGGTGWSTDYRLVTLPVQLSSASLTTLLTVAYGIYDDRHWRAFAWDGSDYVELGTTSFDDLTYNSESSSHAGRSFWLISLSGYLASDTNTFEGSLRGNMQPTSIALSQGWNMIALPWPGSTENPSIELGNVVVQKGGMKFWLTSGNNTITDQCVWDYNGASGYTKLESATDLLVPEKGYWIHVVSAPPVELVIPPDNSVFMTALKRITGTSKSSSGPPPAPPGVSRSTEGGNGCFIDTGFY